MPAYKIIANPHTALGGYEFIVTSNGTDAVIRQREGGRKSYTTIARATDAAMREALDAEGWDNISRNPAAILRAAERLVGIRH